MAKRRFPLSTGDVSVAEWGAMARYWLGAGPIDGFLNELAVTGDSSGRQVKVATGAAWARGHYFDSDAIETIAIAANSSGQPRKDLVVLRLNLAAATAEEMLDFVVIQGTPSASPTLPPLVDTATVYDVPLAYVDVANGAVTIASGDVKDQRVFATANGAPKAVGYLSGGGLAWGRNIATATHATGKWTVTLTKAFPSTNYAVDATAQASQGLTAVVDNATKTAQSFQIWTYNDANVVTDANFVSVAVYGDW